MSTTGVSVTLVERESTASTTPSTLSPHLQGQRGPRAYYDEEENAIAITLMDGEEFLLPPALVRRNDTSASSVNEWTGEG